MSLLRSAAGRSIPVHRIDLSLPPRERYKALAQKYKDDVATITPLFNELLGDLGVPVARQGEVNTLARWLMRGLHSREETEELKGISDVTGVAMYLLVALNVVLDLLMGCTSSIVRSNEGTCWHLRTLDWGMDALRKVVVQLDFIRSKDSDRVLASSITYVGFVGVLTGVRQNLSMSLNFRAVHQASNLRFYAHHLAVLLGFRPSISSILRSYLLNKGTASLQKIEHDLSTRHTTAAYLTFSDGEHGLSLEKDFASAEARHDEEGFLVATNHDVVTRAPDKTPTPGAQAAARIAHMEAMEELIEDSTERADCISGKWRRHCRSQNKGGGRKGISDRQVAAWVSDWPTTNETTHYAVVLNPAEGEVEWARVYHEPMQQPGPYHCN